jgi:CMP-N,N'-diacetyllegionaminic acid synthase
MLNGHSILGIIPAIEAHTATMPHFATRSIAGHALFAWSYFAALASGYIDEIVLLSADHATLATAQRYGLRALPVGTGSAESDKSLTQQTQYALQKLSSKFDYCVSVAIAAPLKLSSDINRALEAFDVTHAECLVSVCELPARMYHAFTLPCGQQQPIAGMTGPADRQDLPAKYYANGAITISRTPRFKLGDDTPAQTALSYLMPTDRSVYIETETDFLLCDILLRSRSAVVPFPQRNRRPNVS